MNPLSGGSRAYEVLIRDQFGAISRRQALAAGLTRRQIDALLASGTWVIAAPAVYRATMVPPSFRQRCMVACLWSDPEGRVSHAAAGALWRLEGIERPETIVSRFLRSRDYAGAGCGSTDPSCCRRTRR
jgi:hypothetical protein